MGIDSRRLFARIVSAFDAPGLNRVTKSVSHDSRTTPPAVLTYPVRDLQGDVLEPAGLDLWEFENVYERLSNFEHGAYIGTTAVEFKSLPVLNAERVPDERLGVISLPVGVTTFFESAADAGRHTLRRFDTSGRVVGTYSADECARLADQVRPLVPNVFGGVSLEFRPDGPEGVAFKSLGKSPMLDRPAYHFTKTKMIGLASACDLPVNPVAGYSVADEATIARAEKALRLCERPSTLDVIRKSLRPLTALLKPPSGRVTAPVRRDPQMSRTATPPRRVTKAEMYEDDPMAVGPSEVMEEVDVMRDEDMGDDMPATAAAAMQGAQGAADLCNMIRDMAKKGEHVKGRKKLSAICDQLDKLAAEYQAVADMVLADVGDGEAMEETEMEADPMPVELDDDGGLLSKSLSATRWRPLRAAFVTPTVFKKAAPWTPEQLKTAKKAHPKPASKDETEKLLEWAMAKIDELEGKRA